MLRQLYLSPLGRLISLAMRALALVYAKPFMVYGYRDRVSGKFRKHTRISSHASIGDSANVSVSDHVWVAHHAIVDGSNGVEIGEGVQIGFWAGIFTHSSHISARLHGRDYIGLTRDQRKGYVRGRVVIGDYTCLCSGAILLPGVTVGQGALIAAGAVVAHDVPDFGIVRGNPARLVGDTRRLDATFQADPNLRKSYFAPAEMAAWLEKKRLRSAA